jgi:hypothetical protein
MARSGWSGTMAAWALFRSAVCGLCVVGFPGNIGFGFEVVMQGQQRAQIFSQ